MKIRVLLAAAVAISALTAFPALAGEWRISGESINFASGIDFSRIREVAGKKQAWTIKSYKTKSEGASYTLTLLEFDCRMQTGAQLRYVDYDSEGNVLASSTRALPADPITPDSIAEDWFNAACFGEGRDETSFDSVLEFHDAVQSYYRGELASGAD